MINDALEPNSNGININITIIFAVFGKPARRRQNVFLFQKDKKKKQIKDEHRTIITMFWIQHVLFYLRMQFTNTSHT